MSRESKTSALPLPVQFLAAWVGAWLGRHQAQTIEFLCAENRALREQLGGRPISLTDGQRRRLAELGKAVGRKTLADVATIASPETILKWGSRIWWPRSTTARQNAGLGDPGRRPRS